jgi:2-keto-myo-inositol isomerase
MADDETIFALNHVVAPAMTAGQFFALCTAVGIRAAEIRNDLAGTAILDGTPAAAIRDQAAAAGISLLSINALQRFNDWTRDRAAEAIALADYAREAGAQALVLVPVNDGSGRDAPARQRNLAAALRGLAPILSDRGITGLVEPLGFASCSLRSKREAVDAIEEAGLASTFRIVHDTFHHHLAGETDLFPGLTGLVHVSGVEDRAVAIEDLRDEHRVLVGEADLLDNAGQIRALRAGGYFGPISFEPFSPLVQRLDDPAAAIRRSMAFLASQL